MMRVRPFLRPCLGILLLIAGIGASEAQSGPTSSDHGTPYLVRDLGPGIKGLGPRGLRPLDHRVLGYTFDLVDTSAPYYGDWLLRSGLVVSDGTTAGTFPLIPDDVGFSWWAPEAGPDGINFFDACEAPVTGQYGCSIRKTSLWRTDGTVEGTFPITDWGAIPSTASVVDGHYMKERGLYFFRGTDPQAELEDFELWATDGTREGTRLVADLNPEGSSYPGNMVEMDSLLYFTHKVESDEGTRWLLGRSDGTRKGTESRPGPTDQRNLPFRILRGDDELFVFYDIPGEEGLSLWREDGSPEGLTLLADNLGPRSAGGLTFAAVGGNKLYFLTGDAYTGRLRDNYLWVSDGTPEGTRQLPRPPGTVLRDDAAYDRFRVLGDRFYFMIDDGIHGWEPWVSDGTSEGTRMILDTCPGPCSPESAWVFYGLLGDVLLPVPGFLVYDPGTEEIRTLTTACGDGCSVTSKLAEAGGFAYFLVFEPTNGKELWASDGTNAGTARLSSFADDISFSHHLAGGFYEPTRAAVAGSHLFFGAGDSTHGWELWALPLPKEGNEFPRRPPREPLTTPELPGFAIWVEITPGSQEAIAGRAETACIPETLCVSGAIPARSEVFVRVVGPKLNGRLWPTIVKFTTSTVEVWIEQVATGTLRYYRLEGASPGSSELPGLFDRDGFPPG